MARSTSTSKTSAKTTEAKTSTSREVTPAPEAEYIDLTPTEAVARVRSAFGSIDDVERTIDGMDEVRKQAERAYRVWAVVAERAIRTRSMTQREFAETAGTSPMGVTRLVRVGKVLTTKSGAKQDALKVRALVNGVGQGRKGSLTSDQFKGALAALAEGKPYAEAVKVSHAEVGNDGRTVTDGKRAGKRDRVVSVEAAPATIVEQIAARVGAGKYSAAVLADLAEAVETLTSALAEATALAETA